MKHETYFIEKPRKYTVSGNEIWSEYVTLQSKIFYQKILRKIWPEN